MCFDICTINIRVSIRVRGLHLVFRVTVAHFGDEAALVTPWWCKMATSPTKNNWETWWNPWMIFPQEKKAGLCLLKQWIEVIKNPSVEDLWFKHWQLEIHPAMETLGTWNDLRMIEVYGSPSRRKHSFFAPWCWTIYHHLPSGKRLQNYGKSPFYSWVNQLFLWQFSSSRTVNVYQHLPHFHDPLFWSII